MSTLVAGDGLQNSLSGFQTVELWHRDIHHNHGGAEFLGQLNRLAAGLGLTDHLDIALPLPVTPEALLGRSCDPQLTGR